jgi:hypothetical protein
VAKVLNQSTILENAHTDFHTQQSLDMLELYVLPQNEDDREISQLDEVPLSKAKTVC